MTKISDNINSYQNLAQYDADMGKEYPNVSYLIDEEEVKWNKYDPDHIVCVYNVTSTSSATKLLNSSSGITYQIIDGVKQQYIQKTYTFNTLGEHTVKYKLSGTSIPQQMFYICNELINITIPNSVTNIGDSAFQACENLRSITIPSGVTSIGNGALSYCSSLTRLTIPSGVTSIGQGAFGGCGGLVSITVDSNNSKYDSRNNCNAIIETATNALIVGCKNTVIPNTVTSIGSGAFYGRTNLTSLTIPNSVTSIGNSAFEGCSSLTSVTIPNSVTSIGYNAFSSCSSLTSVTIGSGVRSIGDYAFSWCLSLTRITVQAITPPTLGESVFINTNYCPIYVPASRVNIYKATSRWSDYASRIQAI